MRAQALAPGSLATMGGEGLNQGMNIAGKGINDSLRLTGEAPHKPAGDAPHSPGCSPPGPAEAAQAGRFVPK